MKKLFSNKLDAKMFIGIAILGAIVSVAFVKSSKKEKGDIISKSKVAPPLKNVDVTYTAYKINSQNISNLTYQTGSVIKVPANAFVDEKGKLVKGEVEIKYREFHNPADFFVSGIPMTYDSAGIQYHFESAGMLEILAFQNGKPVFVNQTKKIIVEMVSKQQDNKYNIYQYDSIAGNWNFVYKDKAGFNKKLNDTTIESDLVTKNKITSSIVSKENDETDVLKPKILNVQNYQFSLAVDKTEFPEIAIYSDVQFEVAEKEKGFNPLYASITWADVTIKKTKNTGSYLMTLSKAEEMCSFEVHPVFDSIAYEAAFKLYEKTYKMRKQKEYLAKKGNDSINYVLNEERIYQNDFAQQMIKNRTASIETQAVVQRVFVISGFGIWNSDCPAALPKGEQFAATYVDSTGQKLTFKTLYLVEKGRNAMFAITSYSRLYYDPTKKNILWAVTADNKLAIFEEEKFKDLKIKNDSCIVSMKIISKSITKAYEVKTILNI